MMFNPEFLHSDLFIYFVLPVLIFLARITDVSIGTIRIIVVSRGNRLLAPVLGFFEVLIWIFAISNIIQHLNNMYAYLAYAGGFATGNYIGLKIEERLAMGINLVRIFTKEMADDLMNELHARGYGATIIKAKGRDDDVSIIYSIVKRKEIKQVVEIIEDFNPNSFYTIEDIKYVSHEDFSRASKNHHERHNIFKRWRLGK
jgi:uncharacterized protein YebE (UPF0316 family)